MSNRSSNFELLRIIAMFLIVAHHYSIHGGWTYPAGLEFNKFYVQSLTFGKVGVSLFVLITGYFLCKSRFKLDGLIGVIANTWFYSMFIRLFFLLTGLASANPKDLIRSLLPFEYWFVNAYICLLVFCPFLNIMFKQLDKKGHFHLLCLLTILVVLPILNSSIGYFALFIYLYCIGAFLRIYFENTHISWKLTLPLGIASALAVLISIAALDFLSKFNDIFNYPLYFTGINSPFILALSVVIFICFKQMNLRTFKSVNYISSAMFGVYLIHDHFMVRQYLWEKLLENNTYLNSNILPLHSLASIVAVFIVCVIIECLRKSISKLLRFNTLNKKLSMVFDRFVYVR